MTIIIKTQSGNLVFNLKNIYVCTNEQVFELKNIAGEDGSNNDFLGAYKTEKRAQEVIDDLFKYLERVAGTASTLCTYTMPKE